MVDADNLTNSSCGDDQENKYIKINYPNGQVGFMMPDEIAREEDRDSSSIDSVRQSLGKH